MDGLAALPDGAYATQAWHPDRSSQGFVYLLGVAGQPHGTVFRPFVHDLGLLRREDLARVLRADVPDTRDAVNVIVEPIRNPGGDVVAYVVRHRDVSVNPTFGNDGRYRLYVHAGEKTESGGGGSGGGGGGGM